jgi:hypothetical protein
MNLLVEHERPMNPINQKQLQSNICMNSDDFEKLQERLYSQPQFKRTLWNRAKKPDFQRLTDIVTENQSQYLSQLRQLFLLPTATIKELHDLLVFRYVALPDKREAFILHNEEFKLRLCSLFELLIDMALQGSSLWPKNPILLARHVLSHIESNYHLGRTLYEPLYELLFKAESGKPTNGFNVTQAANIGALIEYEHEQQNPGYDRSSKLRFKVENYGKKVIDNPEFHADWAAIKRHFNVEIERDAQGIIRRTKVTDTRWAIPPQPAPNTHNGRFQMAFDYFCWKWFLGGMNYDQPLVEKLSYNITPYGTEIFIPGYWEFNPAQDLDWKKLSRLHRARKIKKPGRKRNRCRTFKISNWAKLIQADEIATLMKFRNDERYKYLKFHAGLSEKADNRTVRRIVNYARKQLN